MGIACQEENDAVEQFQQHMPSPDPELTAQLQKALSDSRRDHLHHGGREPQL